MSVDILQNALPETELKSLFVMSFALESEQELASVKGLVSRSAQRLETGVP